MCIYSSAEETPRQGTVSAATGAQGLCDVCPCLTRGLAAGRGCSVNDGRDHKRQVNP